MSRTPKLSQLDAMFFNALYNDAARTGGICLLRRGGSDPNGRGGMESILALRKGETSLTIKLL